MPPSVSQLVQPLSGQDTPGQKLFQLNLPKGWNTSNDYLSGRLLASEEPPFGLSWEDLNEEMIFVVSTRCSLAIDLGWYPDFSPQGQFRIEVVDFDNLVVTYAKPVREFTTRSVWAAKRKLEEWMAELDALQAERSAAPDVGHAAQSDAAGSGVSTPNP